jgi:hypothetical protein
VRLCVRRGLRDHEGMKHQCVFYSFDHLNKDCVHEIMILCMIVKFYISIESIECR